MNTKSRTAQRTIWLNKFHGFRIRLSEVRDCKGSVVSSEPLEYSLEIIEIDGVDDGRNRIGLRSPGAALDLEAINERIAETVAA